MRRAHSLRRILNLDLLRSFFEIAAVGSLNKAAERLRVSQSTLTRQMNVLEHEIGGPLFERGPAGVALTTTGHTLATSMRPVLTRFDAVLADVRKSARGQSASLRIGYITSAAREYLNPALAALRQQHPEVKVKLSDLSPGEQLEELRKGELDVALLGHPGAFATTEFYAKRLAAFPTFAALPETHPLARQKALALSALREELFVGADERDVPGHNRWISQACRKAGFRARFVENAESLTHGLALVVTEGAVSLLPEYALESRVPGVVFLPLKEPAPKWDLLLAWQRGRTSAALRALLAALPASGR